MRPGGFSLAEKASGDCAFRMNYIGANAGFHPGKKIFHARKRGDQPPERRLPPGSVTRGWSSSASVMPQSPVGMTCAPVMQTP